METRLVTTSAKILRLYLQKYLTKFDQKRLTSGFFLSKESAQHLINSISFGSNEIIDKIGRDRSHISKTIQFLKNAELLEEVGKYEEGKRKDTRITNLGLEVAEIAENIVRYEDAYSHFADKISQYHKLDSSIAYELALKHARYIEYGLLSSFISIVIARYTSIMLKPRIKSDARSMIEEMVITSIRDRLRGIAITNDYAIDEAKDYAINDLLGTISMTYFHFCDSALDYLKYDYEDLPNDRNRKFIKEETRELLKILTSFLKPNIQMIPHIPDFQKFKEFLPYINFEDLKKEWSRIGVGSQILSLRSLKKEELEIRILTVGENGETYDTTVEFSEIRAGAYGSSLPSITIGSCAHFRTKLKIAIHRDMKISFLSKEFKSNFVSIIRGIAKATVSSDYVEKYGLEIPTIDIIKNRDNIIRGIAVGNLPRELHEPILQIISHAIIRTLTETNPEFRETLTKISQTAAESKKGKDGSAKDH